MLSVHQRDSRTWLFAPNASLGHAPVELLHEAAVGLVRHYVATPERNGRGGFLAYVNRLADAAGYHWWRFCQDRFVPLRQVIGNVQNGTLAYGRYPTDVFAEVALVEGVCQQQPGSNELFIANYSDAIRAAAFGAGGLRAQQDLEGFEADLMLPRNQRPPRLSTFGGLTPLKFWLSRVVRNEWNNRARATPLPPRDAGEAGPSPEDSAVEHECLAVFRPLLQSATATLKKREELLLRMVLMDGVPNQEVARLWGVHTSTVTRARQRACRKLADRFWKNAQALGRQAAYRDCVQWISTAPSGRLLQLADVLASNIWDQ